MNIEALQKIIDNAATLPSDRQAALEKLHALEEADENGLSRAELRAEAIVRALVPKLDPLSERFLSQAGRKTFVGIAPEDICRWAQHQVPWRDVSHLLALQRATLGIVSILGLDDIDDLSLEIEALILAGHKDRDAALTAFKAEYIAAAKSAEEIE
jgi:hypothetical protein